MNANRRGTLVLLGVLALILFLVLASGAVAPAFGAGLLAAYICMLALMLRPPKLRLPRLRSSTPIITRAGRDAAARIGQPISLMHRGYILQDVGLVVDERRRDGLSLRRARLLSMDDESIRPYVVFHYPQDRPSHAGVLRFELLDSKNQPQFIYEMEAFFQSGENLILPDYRLRLKGNNRLKNTGGWTLNLSVDGILLGRHQFTLAPSMHERLRNAPDGEVSARLVGEVHEEALPLSLEELLRNRSRS